MAVKRPMWPKNKIRTNHIGPEKEKVKVKARPRTKVGTMVLRARILEKQKMTREKVNPRPSPQQNRLSLPQSLLPMWQTVHGVEIMAKLIGTGMTRVKPGGPPGTRNSLLLVHLIAQHVMASSCNHQPWLQQLLRPRFLTSILDNGCTRSMGSSFAVKRFVRAIQDGPYRGVSCWYEPVETTFTFANGQVGKSTYQLVISFDTTPPCKTTVDVLDQGRVPILFSIEQMRNLNVTIAHQRKFS